MFTGIVQGYCEVIALAHEEGVTTMSVDLGKSAEGLDPGASVALNGCCLTATSVNAEYVTFDIVRETSTLTNLGSLEVGDRLNVERSLSVGEEIGGHILSGHVACMVRVSAVRANEGHKVVVFEVPKPWLNYVMDKGFVALNGASLTISEFDRDRGTAAVSLIPETLDRTGFKNVRVGERINLEVDSRTQAVVETVKDILRDKTSLRDILSQ